MQNVGLIQERKGIERSDLRPALFNRLGDDVLFFELFHS